MATTTEAKMGKTTSRKPRWVKVERFVLTLNGREVRRAVVPFAHASDLIDEGWTVVEVGGAE